MNSLTARRYHLIETPALQVLDSLPSELPLYVHGRVPMAEVAVITTLGGCFVGHDGCFRFPETGLAMSLDAIRAMHCIEVEDEAFPSVALEIATPGEPRSVSFAAVPSFSNPRDFGKSLASHPARELTSSQYDTWRARHHVPPHQCPCCKEAAANRRLNPANNPIARILAEAVHSRTVLRCQVHSKVFNFRITLTPGELLVHDSHLGITGEDQHSLIEIDPGFCHSMTIRTERIDSELVTILNIHDSLGTLGLTLETPGEKSAAKWAEICSE